MQIVFSTNRELEILRTLEFRLPKKSALDAVDAITFINLQKLEAFVQ